MSEKKYFLNKVCYCLLTLSFFIFSGCATTGKREQVIGIQKVRIQKLQQQLKVKDEIIQNLKTNKWVRSPSPYIERKDLKSLDQLIQSKKWVMALKVSSELKKKYPNSLRLTKQRIKIFKKMGLKKQARSEILQFKKNQTKRKKKSRKL